MVFIVVSKTSKLIKGHQSYSLQKSRINSLSWKSHFENQDVPSPSHRNKEVSMSSSAPYPSQLNCQPG